MMTIVITIFIIRFTIVIIIIILMDVIVVAIITIITIPFLSTRAKLPPPANIPSRLAAVPPSQTARTAVGSTARRRASLRPPPPQPSHPPRRPRPSTSPPSEPAHPTVSSLCHHGRIIRRRTYTLLTGRERGWEIVRRGIRLSTSACCKAVPEKKVLSSVCLSFSRNYHVRQTRL